MRIIPTRQATQRPGRLTKAAPALRDSPAFFQAPLEEDPPTRRGASRDPGASGRLIFPSFLERGFNSVWPPADKTRGKRVLEI